MTTDQQFLEILLIFAKKYNKAQKIFSMSESISAAKEQLHSEVQQFLAWS